MQFLRQVHRNHMYERQSNDEIIFCLNLSCHYSQEIKQWFQANNVPFVTREENSANNVLQADIHREILDLIKENLDGRSK